MRKRTGFLLHETGTEYANLPAEEDQTVRNSLRYIDNHDSRIPYYELMLEQGLADIPELDLPKGYHYENFKPGDRAAWISVEKSAKEFASDEEGEEAWQRYYAGREKELETRMFFVVDEEIIKGTDVAAQDKGYPLLQHYAALALKNIGSPQFDQQKRSVQQKEYNQWLNARAQHVGEAKRKNGEELVAAMTRFRQEYPDMSSDFLVEPEGYEDYVFESILFHCHGMYSPSLLPL